MKRMWCMAGASFALGLAMAVSLSGCSGDAGTVLTVTITPVDPVTADGRSAATLQAKVMQGGKAVASGSVNFRSIFDGVSFDPITDPTSAPAGPISRDIELTGGLSVAKLYSLKKGLISVIVTFTAVDTAEVFTKDVSVNYGGSAVKIASFKFLSAEPTLIGLKGSGNQESSIVTFQALDANNAACPDGLPVTYSVSKDIATIDPASGKTNPLGQVSTTVKSGMSVGSIKVIVTAGTVTAESDPITIAGGVANWNNLSVTCNRLAIGGFGLQQFGLDMTCYAHVADRNGQKIAGVDVSFIPEAGSMLNKVTTDDQGTATNIYKTQEPFPVDVKPAGAADYANMMPSWMQSPLDNSQEPSWSCKIQIPTGTVPMVYNECNPRDGLVTIIAITTGEEGYEDTNQNGKYDLSEPWVDLPEPYVDVNDDGKYEDGEPYSDVNGNGHWDGPNNKWDASTTIWKATKILWTGEPKVDDTRFYGYFLNGTNRVATLTVPHCGALNNIMFAVWDRNFNKPAMEYGEACDCEGAAVSAFDFLFGKSWTESDDSFGHAILGGLSISDKHTCAPDCILDNSCAPLVDTLSCTSHFTTAQTAEVGVLIKTYTYKIGVNVYVQ
jgi:hypothetical protein